MRQDKMYEADCYMTQEERKYAIETFQEKMKEAIDILQEAWGMLSGNMVRGDKEYTLYASEMLGGYIGELAQMANADWM